MTTTTIQIGYDKGLLKEDPATFAYTEGTPITIGGLDLTLSVRDGILTVHGSGSKAPVVRAVAGNEIMVKAGDLFGDGWL
jgi:hypothetical protein